MWLFWGFSGLSSENSLFYSVLRRHNVWDGTSQTHKMLVFLQCFQLVPAKFLVSKASHICELHFALRFLAFIRKPKLPHYTWRYQPHTLTPSSWLLWRSKGIGTCRNIVRAGGSPVGVGGMPFGVWTCIFRALGFQGLEPGIWWKSLFCQSSSDFPARFRLWDQIFAGLWAFTPIRTPTKRASTERNTARKILKALISLALL